jgi:hypothetical protein
MSIFPRLTVRSADDADLQIKGAARDVASMIGGGGQYQSLGMETSSHGHGGSITEDFVSVFFAWLTTGWLLMSSMPSQKALFFGTPPNSR